MAILTVATAVVGLIALSAFGLVLVLARRLHSVTERVDAFLPVALGSLPEPGTPIGEFAATAVTGELISHQDFLHGERIFAVLSTGCGDCRAEVAAFREVGARLQPPAVVGVIGPAADRAPMVGALAGHAIVLEENSLEPITASFQIREFPTVLLVRDGQIQAADHALMPVLRP